MRVSFILWLTVIVASVAVGLVAYYFAYIGEQSELFREAMMDKAEWLLYLLPAVGLVIITLIRVKLFIGTEGTGIPQTIAALEMKSDADRKKMLSMRILVGKVLLTTLGLFSGASMGREGPTVQVGACIMYCCRKVTTFPQHLVQRGLILAGGAVTPPMKENTPRKMSNQPKSSTIASAAIPGRAIAKIPNKIRSIPSTINHFQLIILKWYPRTSPACLQSYLWQNR